MAKKAAKNVTPPLECPHTAEMFLPHTTQSSGVLATKLVQFNTDVAEHRTAVRKHFADGGTQEDVPKFPQSKFFNPNTGRMSRSARDKLIDAYNDALEEGKATPPFPPTYNPVEVDALHAMNCGTRIRRGTKSAHPKPPAEWDKKWGSWYLKDEDGKPTVPSGWFVDTATSRRPHPANVVDRVDDPEDNVLAIGNVRYVVGTDQVAAPFLIHAHRGGNYGAVDTARKEMSTEKVKGIGNLVFRIEEKPNEGGAFVVKGDWRESCEVPFMPGQVLTAGYLYDGDTELKPGQVRKIIADDGKGNGKRLRFKSLSEPIVCPGIPWSGKDGLWAGIQVAQGRNETKKQRERDGRSDSAESTPQSKSIENAIVQCRCDPCEATPFGFASVALHMVPYYVATGNGPTKDGEFSMGIVIGARSNAKYIVGANEAKRKLAEAEAEAEAPKPKKKKKSDAAPPVEAAAAVEPATA